MNRKLKAKIIFHIGLEKTGTTSFQSFCTDNRALLRRESVLYPTNNFGFSKNSHEPLVACYFPKNAASQLVMRSSRRDKAVILRSLNREIERASADTILISAEHFSSRFSATHIRQLAADFSDYDCQIAVVVRDHVARILSAYSTTIASGRYLTLQDFVDEICHTSNLYIRYRETISQWEDIFGAENMIVFPYREKYNVVELLAKSLISPNIQLRRTSGYAQNKSFGASAVEARRLINEDLSHDHQPDASKFRAASILGHIRHAIRKNTIRRSEDRLRLNEDQFRRVNDIAEIDRHWLEDRYRIRLDDQLSGRDVL
jgi:hypothetical protein